MIGQTIAHYKVTGKLGAGGMGEVYRAMDTKLGREVALKVLPEGFAADAQRMARFQREAQVLASLNHPNIAAIYGLEEASGSVGASLSSPSMNPTASQRGPAEGGPYRAIALVMELVEGPTLAERIGAQAGRAVPLEEALPIAKQIADALEYAHEHGIIHRDLKPANIKLTKDGAVKVLDFGLAKALAEDSPTQDVSTSPTLSVAATRVGIILGTAAYMAPEQAKGKAADRRADIWSFGAVLYEMLSGRRLYTGETASEILAAVILKEPSWEALPANLPPRLRLLLQRCLDKDARHRLQAMGDARVEIEEVLRDPRGASTAMEFAGQMAAPRAAAWRRVLPWALAGALAVALGQAYWQRLRGTGGPTGVKRLMLPLDPATSLGLFGAAVAVSPAGDLTAFAASEPSGLYVRGLADSEARLIAGTNSAHSPFFSPDGRWIGFFTTTGQLKKVAVAGGAPTVVAESADGRGGTWGPEGAIVFTPSMNSGLYRVPADGGKAEILSQPNRSKGERSHRWPRFLPGGKAVLFTLEKGSTYDDAAVAVLRLDTGEVKTLVEGGYDARYSPTGHLLYCRTGQLFAVPFDPQALALRGAAVALPARLADLGGFGTGNYEITDDGTLVHVSGSAQELSSSLLWGNSTGQGRPATEKRGSFVEVSLAPQKRLAALSVSAADNDIWLLDLERDALTRLTTRGENGSPVWSPDGRRIAFASDRGSGYSLFWMRPDGSGAEQINTSAFQQLPYSWSPDGRWLAFGETRPESGADIWLLPVENGKPGKPRPFLNQRFNETLPAISPDGRWIAYVSDETGRNEVYLESFPEPGDKVQVSTDGGTLPRWAPRSSRLHFYAKKQLLAVTVQNRPTPSVSRPSIAVARTALTGGLGAGGLAYDVAADGRILLIESDADLPARRIHVVLNWFQELRRASDEAGKN